MKKIVKIVCIYVAFFIIAELLVRALLPEYKSLHHGMGITGGISFRLNSYGLRDHEFDFDKKGAYRILCLGDSVTFGTQNRLEDTYPKVLEGLLNSAGCRRYQVINAGGIGGCPPLEYEYLKGRGITFDPDFVIVGLCLNDIGDSYVVEARKNSLMKMPDFWKNTADFRLYKDSLGKWKKGAPLLSNIKVQFSYLRWYLRSKSYLYSFIDAQLTIFLHRSGIKKFSFDFPEEKESLSCFGIADTSGRAWELLLISLLDIKRFLDTEHIGFMVVVFPYQFQLSDHAHDNFLNIDKRRFTIDPQKVLTDFGKTNNIIVLDLAGAYRESNKTLYFPFDYCHPNADGHRIAAREIYHVLAGPGGPCARNFPSAPVFE